MTEEPREDVDIQRNMTETNKYTGILGTRGRRRRLLGAAASRRGPGTSPEVRPPRECVVRCLESWCLRIERLLPPDCEDTMPYIVGAERPARPATLLDASYESPLRTALPPTSLSRAPPPLVECARAPSLAPSPPRAPRDQGARARSRAPVVGGGVDAATRRPDAGGACSRVWGKRRKRARR
ncbi:hypothetical protein MTO96_006623 [Rhipicephalus appendiculatus]